jgi:S1-C subfamily serine protease
MRVRVLAGLVLVFGAGIVAGQLASRLDVPGHPIAAAAVPVSGEPVAPLASGMTDEERRNIEIFRRASGSVVYITTSALRRDFFFDVHEIPRGSGTGFFWDSDGHVVTNFHVVEGAHRFAVSLADRSGWEATLVGAAPEKDLAVLRIDAPRERLVPLTLGRSDRLQVGQTVLALGNPFGLDQSLTVGVVSALGRELRSPARRIIRDVIQTDAAINPGNSGGPLLDSSGALIGINTAIYSPSGASAGIGFAVPVDTVRRLVPQLIRHGRPIEPGVLGLEWLSDRLAVRFGLEGAVVRSVEPGSQAEDLGFQGIRVDRSGRYVLGDVVIAIDDRPVRTVDELRDAFELAGVGGEVVLTIDESDGGQRKVRVRLERLG